MKNNTEWMVKENTKLYSRKKKECKNNQRGVMVNI